MTPMKRFKKKKAQIIIQMTKKYPKYVLLSYIGPCLIIFFIFFAFKIQINTLNCYPELSIVAYMISTHPFKEAVMIKDYTDSNKVSKLK